MSDYQLPPLSNHKQFEYLIRDLFNEQYHTASFKCYGKNGHKQRGIDILSSEQSIVVQCKNKDLTRSAMSLKSELLNDIKGTLIQLKTEPKIHFTTAYIATNMSEHTDYDDYCAELKGELQLPFSVVFWGWEHIQQQASASQHTLKRHYPQFNIQTTSTEQQVVSRLQMRNRIRKDFADWLQYDAGQRKRRSRMIIHSIDDKHYPEHVLNADGQYQWFGAEIDSLKHNGLSFITDLKEIYVYPNNQWTDKLPFEGKNISIVQVAQIQTIALDDIIEYDLRGDEHYLCPHFFCRFNHKGQPFTSRYYRRLKDMRYITYEEDTRKNINE